MARIPVGVALLTAASLAAVVACGSSEADAPPPPPPATTSVSPTPPQPRLAPPVTNPRDASGIAKRPCDLLTPEQRASFGFNQPGTRRELIGGVVQCMWTDAGSTRQLTALINTREDRVNEVYPDRELYPFFEPIDVAGLPGVLRQAVAGGDTCDAAVSLTESQSLEVSFSNLRSGTPVAACGEARRITEVILGNLPPPQ